MYNGVSVFCSQNLGAGKIKRIRKGLWQGVGVGFIYGLLIGLVLIFAGILHRTDRMRYLSVKHLDFLTVGTLDRCRDFF